MFSCDSLVCVGNSTADKRVIVAKNSDRSPNECSNIKYFARQKHETGSNVKCTYIEIPQTEETFAFFGCFPYFMFGCEMGSNEFGVTIANEAVFSHIPAQKEEALLGMDMIRLCLERTKTAKEALDLMIFLLVTFGQGGNCEKDGELYYNNSFIIADRNEAFILETVLDHFVWKKVKDFGSISNSYSIHSDYDGCSEHLIEFAREHNCLVLGINEDNEENEDKIDFAASFADFLYTRFGKGNERRSRSEELLAKYKPNITVSNIMGILRDHNTSDRSSFNFKPCNDAFCQSICMHKSFGPVRISQTVSSVIFHLANNTNNENVNNSISNYDIYWLTGTSNPCLSIFKPIIDIKTFKKINYLTAGDEYYDKSSFFWQHEKLFRNILFSFDYYKNSDQLQFLTNQSSIEEQFLDQVYNNNDDSYFHTKENSTDFCLSCFSTIDDYLKKDLKTIKTITPKIDFFLPFNNILYNLSWWYANRKIKLHLISFYKLLSIPSELFLVSIPSSIFALLYFFSLKR